MLSVDSPLLVTGNTTPSTSFTKDMSPNGSHTPGRVHVAQSARGPTIANGSTDATLSGGRTTKPHHIFLVTGPAGVGKSSVAAYLSKKLNFPYIEGDEVSLR